MFVFEGVDAAKVKESINGRWSCERRRKEDIDHALSRPNVQGQDSREMSLSPYY